MAAALLHVSGRPPQLRQFSQHELRKPAPCLDLGGRRLQCDDGDDAKDGRTVAGAHANGRAEVTAGVKPGKEKAGGRKHHPRPEVLLVLGILPQFSTPNITLIRANAL